LTERQRICRGPEVINTGSPDWCKRKCADATSGAKKQLVIGKPFTITQQRSTVGRLDTVHPNARNKSDSVFREEVRIKEGAGTRRPFSPQHVFRQRRSFVGRLLFFTN
jgi:hypothetical protein